MELYWLCVYATIWTSHKLIERLISPRKNAVWLGTMMWSILCGAAFKQGHRKLMNVRNCAFQQTFGKHCLSPRQWSTESNNQIMYSASIEGHTRSSSTYSKFKTASINNHQWLLCGCQCTQGNILCHWKTYCVLVKWVIPLDCFIQIYLCDSSWTRSPSMTLSFALHLAKRASCLCFTKY